MSFVEQVRAALAGAQQDGVASGLTVIPLVLEVEMVHGTELDWDVIPNEPEFFADDVPRCWALVDVMAADSMDALDHKARVLIVTCRDRADSVRLRDTLTEALKWTD